MNGSNGSFPELLLLIRGTGLKIAGVLHEMAEFYGTFSERNAFFRAAKTTARKSVKASKAKPKKSGAKKKSVTAQSGSRLKKIPAKKTQKSKVKTAAKKPKTAKKVKPKVKTAARSTTKKKPAAKTAKRKKTASAKPIKKETGTSVIKSKTKTKAKADNASKKRRPRVYSSRAKLSDFFVGDEVIFRAVRDWNDASKLTEMRGLVVAMGSDPMNNVNYIEVQFDIEVIPGKTTKQARRFFVK